MKLNKAEFDNFFVSGEYAKLDSFLNVLNVLIRYQIPSWIASLLK